MAVVARQNLMRNALAVVMTAMLLTVLAVACSDSSSGDSATPRLPALNGAGRVAIIRQGDGPTPTPSLEQAEMGAWLCQSQLRAIEPLVPRIPPSDTELQKKTNDLLDWFHAKCAPNTPDMAHEFDEVFRQLSALPPPTPAVPTVASIGSAASGN